MADSGLPYFFLGLGVGAALGVLYAPKTGDEAREELRVRAGEGREYLRRRSGELKHQAEDILDRGKGAVNVQRDQLTAALEAGRRAYRDATNKNPADGAESAVI